MDEKIIDRQQRLYPTTRRVLQRIIAKPAGVARLAADLHLSESAVTKALGWLRENDLAYISARRPKAGHQRPQDRRRHHPGRHARRGLRKTRCWRDGDAVTAISAFFLRWRSSSKMKRRARPIGEAQSPIARFLRLRKPWGKTPKRTTTRRQPATRPWPAWRCRMDARQRRRF